MTTCPSCHGDGGFVFTENAPLERLCHAIGIAYEPSPVVTCDVCDGIGEVPDDLARDYRAYWTARTDQLLAGVDDGSIRV